jgi:hypothetical protein
LNLSKHANKRFTYVNRLLAPAPIRRTAAHSAYLDAEVISKDDLPLSALACLSSAPLLLAEWNRRVEKFKMFRSSFPPSAAEALRVRPGPDAMGFEPASRRWSIAISDFASGGNAPHTGEPGALKLAL